MLSTTIVILDCIRGVKQGLTLLTVDVSFMISILYIRIIYKYPYDTYYIMYIRIMIHWYNRYKK